MKLMYGLPRHTWLTFDEVVAMGYSPFWCRVLLPLMHHHGHLEVRIKKYGPIHLEFISKETNEVLSELMSQIDESTNEDNFPFNAKTIQAYEFRLVRSGERRRFTFKNLFIFTSGWKPGYA